MGNPVFEIKKVYHLSKEIFICIKIFIEVMMEQTNFLREEISLKCANEKLISHSLRSMAAYHLQANYRDHQR